ncbi:YvrJ family protein [Oceanobacillus sp. CFH 90083]|nr:YvrJ family protein [Oceanobacillus sp. CFH 90083]
MEAWISLFTDIGFPAAVTFYLLHRVEGKLNQLIESIYSISIPKKTK